MFAHLRLFQKIRNPRVIIIIAIWDREPNFVLKIVLNAAFWSFQVFAADHISSENIVSKSAIEFHVTVHL